MRRLLSILAVTALVAAPSLSIAKNPFDFSDWVRKSRTEPGTEDDQSSATPMEAEDQPLQPAPHAQPRNYSDELFGGAQPKAVPQQAERTPTRMNPWYPPQHRERLPDPANMRQGRPRLEDRPVPATKITRDDLKGASSAETLQRFDEFLKTQKVVTADYDDQAKSPTNDIQPVSDSSAGENPWGPEPGSPRDGDSAITKEFPPTNSVEDEEVAADRFSFVEDEAEESSATASRLTETIPTAPGGRRDESEPPTSEAAFREVNPFAIERAPAKNTSPAHPITIEPATGDHQTKSRFSISRTPRSAAPTTPSIETDEAERSVRPAEQRLHEQRLAEQRNADISAVWNLTGPLNIGQECPCELVVTNLRKAAAEDVKIDALLPSALELVDATPAPMAIDGVLRWRLDTMEPGEKRTIQVVLLGSQPGPVELAAQVHFTESKLQLLTVTEPQLSVEVSGPKDVTVGEPATQTVTVRNPGSGVATNIKLEAQVPEGLEHVRGSRLLMNIGSLNPGESRRVRLALAAISGGQQILQVEARGDAGLVQTAAAEVTVVAPELKASISGPGLRYLGREATYTLRVENVGEAETDAVQMVHHVPEGFDFIRADRGARFDESSRMLTWFVGRLGAEQPQELQVTLVAKKVGEYTQAARATSAHGSFADTQLATRIEGTASLVLEVDDLDDPIEVGTETAYEVTITNEGTAGSRDVALACELPEGLSFLRAEGPSEHRAGANAIAFQPVAEVGAGESLTYRVYVKGTVTGDKRFRCRLTSAHLSQPLFTEEFTKFYGE